jgi:hypothetical protein
MADLSQASLDIKLFTEREAARILKLSHRTLQGWRGEGRGPSYVRLGGAIRYRFSDLQKFLQQASSSQERRPTE